MHPGLWTALAAATLVSEDLACVTAGLLIQQGALSALEGTSSCAVGIFAGDLGLWWLGRSGGRWLALCGSTGQRVAASAEQVQRRLARGIPWALITSRFVPGTRLPLYVTCGATGVRFSTFALCTSFAAAAWTPLVVLGAAGSSAAAARAALLLSVVAR